jgi:membrane protein
LQCRGCPAQEIRTVNQFFDLFKRSAQDFLEDDCLSSGAAIAYYTIFSLPPLLTIAFMVATSLGFSEEQVSQVIEKESGLPVAQEDGPLGATGGKSGEDSALGLGNLGVVSKVVGVLMLLFAATGVFGQLQYSLDKAWEVAPDPNRGGIWAFLSKRLLSAGLIVVLGLLLLVSLILTTVIDEVMRRLLGSMEASEFIGVLVNEVVALVVATLLFAAVFKILPDAKLQWRDVWVGAVFTAVLFVLGKVLIGLYLEHANVGSDWGDAAGSLIGALVWVYYSSLIVLFGAELTQVWVTTYGHGIEPAEGAVKVVEKKQIEQPGGRLSPA